MLKNKKIIVVFILMIVFLLTMINFTNASDRVEDLPIVDSDLNEPILDPAQNNQPTTDSNDTNNNEPVLDNNTNKDNSVGNNTKLPQTGVASDSILFVFIGICILSSVYAYVKIRKYNKLH